LVIHPDWTDRRIAEICGVAHETVGRLRGMAVSQSNEVHHLDRRRGRDGKYWPARPGDVRERILEAIDAHPGASLREIARTAGTSHETVRALRRRLLDNALPGPRNDSVAIDAGRCQPPPMPSRDAAFTSTDEGASFAMWFDRTFNGEWSAYIQSVPLSRVYEIEDEARRRANAWSEFAAALNARTTPPRK
jgi:hypothetical protein